MNNCFEYYTLKLTTLSPTFVGSGKKVGKKEFCYSQKGDTIEFIDMNKLIELLVKLDAQDDKDRVKQFEEFMMRQTGKAEDTLYKFMSDVGFQPAQRQAVTIYSVSNNGCFNGDHTLCDISCFMRDGKNRAYIPGSSIKGMIRTMLVQYLIQTSKYEPHSFATTRNNKPKTIKQILAEEAENAENELLHTLRCKLTKNGQINVKDAVNSIMKGLIVSDSEFISDSNFIVCMKYDMRRDGLANKINLARECLRQGVEITFHIKIDKRYFCPKGVNVDFITLFNEMVAAYDSEYCSFYLPYFPMPDGNKKSFESPFVILGGGSGFFGKNITYKLNGFEKGLEKTAELMYPNKINGVYVNPADKDVGISPHVLKDTLLGTTYYHLGICHASVGRSEGI